MTTTQCNGEAVFGHMIWELPPLILHPFADRASSDKLLEESRSALMACRPGANGSSPEEMHRRRLDGRFSELRMLFFLGKDVMRWIGQCAEFAERIQELEGMAVREQSFGTLLTRHMPEAVNLKLQGWGVQDASVIFARAIGLNRLFAAVPEFEALTDDFLQNYHRYADSLFTCWQQTTGFRVITEANFRFALYASGEYTRMLENEWGETASG